MRNPIFWQQSTAARQHYTRVGVASELVPVGSRSEEITADLDRLRAANRTLYDRLVGPPHECPPGPHPGCSVYTKGNMRLDVNLLRLVVNITAQQLEQDAAWGSAWGRWPAPAQAPAALAV